MSTPFVISLFHHGHNYTHVVAFTGFSTYIHRAESSNLVLYQCPEGWDDDGHTPCYQGRQLVAQTLPTACKKKYNW